jgi:hypothetical protein
MIADRGEEGSQGLPAHCKPPPAGQGTVMTVLGVGPLMADPSVNDDVNIGYSGFTDEELTELALAADPKLPLADDAVPLSVYFAQLPLSLPDWYMPPVMVRGGQRWRVPIVLTVIAAFLIIEGSGLCNTFGQLTLP